MALGWAAEQRCADAEERGRVGGKKKTKNGADEQQLVVLRSELLANLRQTYSRPSTVARERTGVPGTGAGVSPPCGARGIVGRVPPAPSA